MKENNSESVTLQREGEVDTEDVTASYGKSEIEEGYEGVPVTQTTLECFYIDTADYTFGGVASEPAHGDVIVRANGQSYQVVSGPDGKSCFDWVLSNQVRMEIYTVRVA
jgi:hypothetical protein